MVTTSSSKKRVKKGVHNGKHGDCWRSDRFDVSVPVSGDGKTPTGRRPEMSEDDDTMTDEGDDGDDDMHQGAAVNDANDIAVPYRLARLVLYGAVKLYFAGRLDMNSVLLLA
jgi:hypothetical protein